MNASLFVGHFAFKLSSSPSFIQDLFLGATPSSDSPGESCFSRSTCGADIDSRGCGVGFDILKAWQEGLQEIQDRSLVKWKQEALDNSLEALTPLTQSTSTSKIPP